MNLVNEETIKALAEGSQSLVKVAAGVSTELVNEAINLYIIESVLSILKFAVVFVIFYIVKRYLESMMDDKSNLKLFKSFKTTAIILSLIFFTTQSFPHLINLSKALVAPKIFLLEKGSELLRGK